MRRRKKIYKGDVIIFFLPFPSLPLVLFCFSSDALFFVVSKFRTDGSGDNTEIVRNCI